MNKLLFSLLIGSSVLLLNSCKSDGYKKAESGLEYHFFVENSDSAKPVNGDILLLDMKYKTENDSILFDTRELTRKFKMQMKEASHKGGCIEDAFAMMRVGDSAHFLIDAENFYTITRKIDVPKGIRLGSKLKFEIKLLAIQSIKEIEKEQQQINISSEQEELKYLDHYLKITNTTVKPSPSGLYFIEQIKGTGKKAIAGKKVIVHYTGSFTDGRVFDSSLKRSQPFEFKLGVGEVIPGWDEGISKMAEGGHATLVIPSKLAYGDKGYGEIISPFTSLVFEIDLIEVKD